MEFIVVINDPDQLAGITWAREQHNVALAPPPDTVAGGMSETPDVLTLDTDQEYVQYVMEQASISYADQKLRAEHRQNYEEAAAAAGRKFI